MGSFFDSIWDTVLVVVLLMFSAVIHEMAHGYAALACGDETAKRAGRLTLNPLAHLDPFGSFILPLMMVMAGGGALAFAKPVPYNPNNLKHPVRDEVIVAFAGPFSNLVQALIGSAILRYMIGAYTTAWPEWTLAVADGLSTYVYVNLILMFFNLIPLPPLDGSAIISPFLRGEARMTYYKIQRYSLPILLAVMYLVPMVTQFNPVSAYLSATAGRLYNVFLGF
ncbi:MAG: site-2 protease family protein [Atopobiaceae bacterium]|nr:site-2 protease family protein [Atopobiaceae bacterium]